MTKCRQYRVDNQAGNMPQQLALAGGRTRARNRADFFEVVTRTLPYYSKIGQSAKLLVRVCYRLGQDCHVIRNPTLTGVLAKQIALVPAYAGNS